MRVLPRGVLARNPDFRWHHAGISLAGLAGGFLLDLTSARAVFVLGGPRVLAVVVLAWTLFSAGLRTVEAERSR